MGFCLRGLDASQVLALERLFLLASEVADSETGRPGPRLHSRPCRITFADSAAKGAGTEQVALDRQVREVKADAFAAWLRNLELPALGYQLHLVPVHLVLFEKGVLNLACLGHHYESLRQQAR